MTWQTYLRICLQITYDRSKLVLSLHIGHFRLQSLNRNILFVRSKRLSGFYFRRLVRKLVINYGIYCLQNGCKLQCKHYLVYLTIIIIIIIMHSSCSWFHCDSAAFVGFANLMTMSIIINVDDDDWLRQASCSSCNLSVVICENNCKNLMTERPVVTDDSVTFKRNRASGC